MLPSQQISYIFLILLVTYITAPFHYKWSFRPIKLKRFTPPLLTEVPISKQVREGSCICVLGAQVLPPFL